MVTWCCNETVPLRIKLMKQRHAELHSPENVTVSTVIYSHYCVDGEAGHHTPTLTSVAHSTTVLVTNYN